MSLSLYIHIYIYIYREREIHVSGLQHPQGLARGRLQRLGRPNRPDVVAQLGPLADVARARRGLLAVAAVGAGRGQGGA